MAAITHITLDTTYVDGSSPWGSDAYLRRDSQTTAGMAAEFDRIIDYIELTVEQVNTVIDIINDNEQAIDGLVQENAASIDDLDTRVSSLETWRAQVQAQVDEIGDSLAETILRVTENDGDILSLQNLTENMQSQVNGLSSTIQSIVDMVEEMSNSVMVFGWYSSLDMIPTTTGQVGEIFAVGSGFVGAELFALAPENKHIPFGTITGTVATLDDLPQDVTDYNDQYYVTDTTSVYNPILIDGEASPIVTWSSGRLVTALVATEESIPPVAATDNDIAMCKVDYLVTSAGNRPANAGWLDVCAVDPSGGLTDDTVYYGWKNGSWFELSYVPGYKMYLYNGSWNRVTDHDVEIDQFLQSVETVVDPSGQPPGTYLHFVFVEADGTQDIWVMIPNPPIYTNGFGLNLTESGEFSVKPKSGSHISATSDGLGFESGYGAYPDTDKAKVGSLKAVATSGSYNDLTDKPTIPSATDASPTTKGIAKLYASTGQNTDGSMTQKSVTDALASAQVVIPLVTTKAQYDALAVNAVFADARGGKVNLSPNGTTTVFTVAGMDDSLPVYVLLNGVLQKETDDYTRSGSTLTTILGYAVSATSSLVVMVNGWF